MTIVVSIPSQIFTPRIITQQRNVPASVRRLKFTLTRESWPVGFVGDIRITSPSGISGDAGGATFEGGDLYTDITGKYISKVQDARTPILLLTSFYGFPDPNSAEPDLPPGQYTFQFAIFQTIRTSLLVERF